MLSKMLIGNGFGCWNTMPTLRRSAVTSSMSVSTPSRVMRPERVTLGVSSTRRLSDRNSVVFPHPDGPINARTSPWFTGSVTWLTATFPPYAIVSASARRRSTIWVRARGQATRAGAATGPLDAAAGTVPFAAAPGGATVCGGSSTTIRRSGGGGVISMRSGSS
jgi:hypothetical protein